MIAEVYETMNGGSRALRVRLSVLDANGMNKVLHVPTSVPNTRAAVVWAKQYLGHRALVYERRE